MCLELELEFVIREANFPRKGPSMMPYSSCDAFGLKGAFLFQNFFAPSSIWFRDGLLHREDDVVGGILLSDHSYGFCCNDDRDSFFFLEYGTISC